MTATTKTIERQVRSRLERVAVVYPSGNTTAVVFDDCPNVDRAALNAAVTRAVARQHPSLPPVEQCCFVIPPTDDRAIARVEMFGREFCGNATRSVVLLVAGPHAGAGHVETSGVTGALAFSVRDDEVTLEMPLPPDAASVQHVAEGVLVEVEGISHLVCTGEVPVDARATLREVIESGRHGVSEVPAFGVTCHDPHTSDAQFCVWVRDVATAFDETACGSGTSAIAIAAAVTSGTSRRLSVRQPSGQPIVATALIDPANGQITHASITGTVEVLHDGPLDL
jgi:diaminopimelate epimerase